MSSVERRDLVKATADGIEADPAFIAARAKDLADEALSPAEVEQWRRHQRFRTEQAQLDASIAAGKAATDLAALHHKVAAVAASAKPERPKLPGDGNTWTTLKDGKSRVDTAVKEQWGVVQKQHSAWLDAKDRVQEIVDAVDAVPAEMRPGFEALQSVIDDGTSAAVEHAQFLLIAFEKGFKLAQRVRGDPLARTDEEAKLIRRCEKDMEREKPTVTKGRDRGGGSGRGGRGFPRRHSGGAYGWNQHSQPFFGAPHPGFSAFPGVPPPFPPPGGPPRGGGGGRGGSGPCFKCGQQGHVVANCPMP